MLREEMKKLFIKQYGFVVMAIVFVGEIILVSILCPRNFFASDYSKTVFFEYMNEFRGELTLPQRDKILAEQEMILDAENAISALELKLYRGDITDRNEFRTEYNELNAVIMHSDAFEMILEKYYYALGDTEKRFIISGNYESLKSDYPDFLMIAAVIIITAAAFLNEENSNLSMLIRTCENGRKCTFKFKVISLISFILACQLLRMLCELFVMTSNVGISELSFPVQSIDFFQNCPYNISIIHIFFIISAIRLLGYFFVASLVMLFAVKLKTPLFTVFIPCSICLLQQFVFEPTAAYCLPTGSLRAVGYIGGNISLDAEDSPDSTSIPFELMITFFFFTVVFITVSVIIADKYYSCKKHKKSKKAISFLTLVIVCCYLSGCSKSEVRSVVYNACDSFFVVQNDNYYFVSDEDGITMVNKADDSKFQIIRDPFLTSAGVYSMSICDSSLYCLNAFGSKKIDEIFLDTLSESTIDNGGLEDFSVCSAFSNGKNLFFTTFDEDGVYEQQGNAARKIISEKIYNNQLSFDGRRIFYINGVLELFCYDTQTGEKKLLSEEFARAVYYDGTRVVFSTDKGIFALDNNDFSVNKLSQVNAQRICSDGEIVVFIDDGRLYCLSDEIVPIHDNEPLYFSILTNSEKVIMREYNQTLEQNIDVIVELPQSR